MRPEPPRKRSKKRFGRFYDRVSGPKTYFSGKFRAPGERRPILGSSAAGRLLRNWRKMLPSDFRVDSPGSGTAAGRGLSNGGREGGLLERVEGDARAGAPPAGEHAATVRGCSTSRRRLARRPSRLVRTGPLAHIGSRGSGDASSAAAAPCGVGAQTHTGAQGRGPSTLCSASPNGTEHHRAEWLSVNGGARTAGRSPRPLRGRVRPLRADIRRLQADRASGDAIGAVPRCGNRPCGARSAATAPHSPTQPPERPGRPQRLPLRPRHSASMGTAPRRASAESWRGGRPVRSGRRPTQERSPRRAGPRPIWTPSAPPYRAPLPRLGATPAAKFPQSGTQRRSDTLGGAWHHPGSVLMPPANLGVSDPNSAGGPEGAGPPTPPATPPAPLRAHTAGPAAPPLQRSNVTAPLAGPLRAPSHPTARPTSIRRDPPPPRPLPTSQSWH